MIVYQSAHVTIRYDKENKWLTQTWFHFVTSEEFRKAIDYTVMFVETEQVRVIISDTSKQNAIRPEDSEYAASVMPLLFKKGVKAMAFIIPEDIFTKISLKKFADIEVERQHNVEYFFKEEEAVNWIKTLEKEMAW